MLFVRDFRHALRTLWQNPGFAFTAIAVLALGIGANIAIFSVVYAVILRPLPYPDASRLVFVWQRAPNMPAPFSERVAVARRNYLEWQRQNTVFQEMAAFRPVLMDETGDETGRGLNRKVDAWYASASLFHLLGIEPRVGRLFTRNEERPENSHVAVLTDSYFKRHYRRDQNPLGKSVTLDVTVYTIIGVLPENTDMPHTFFDNPQPEVIVPWPDSMTAETENLKQVEAVARLRRGVSLEQARTEMAVIAERLKNTDREFYELGSTSVFPFSVEDSDPRVNRALYLLLTAAAFLLLIACANLANLTLTRATLRTREIAVRIALGATRGRILSQLLAESLVISLAGAACGVLLAHWSMRLIVAFKPADLRRQEFIAINVPVLIFAAAVAVLTTILFGLWPALAASRVDISSRLKSGGGWGSSAARLRSRQFLIVCEVALALMLLIGAGLMIRSLQQIVSVGVGFDVARLATLDIHLSEKRYPEAAIRAGLARQLISRTQAIPGVMNAAMASVLPLHTVGLVNFHIPGRLEADQSSSPITDFAWVSPSFFQVLGLRLAAGRWLTDADITPKGTGAHVGVVNQEFASKYFPGENPLGKRLQSGDRKDIFEIVGVVENFRPMGAENGVRAEMFRPSLDFTIATLVVRSGGTPELVAKSLLETARSVAPDLPDDKVKTLEEDAQQWTAQRRFNTVLLWIFAGLALVLALLGIYGVLSNLIASRTREIGIRMAVGATPRTIGSLGLRQSMVPVVMGLAIGLAGCVALSRLMESLLFQVRAHDPVTLMLAVATIMVTSAAALWRPLRRAAMVDCAVALREE